MNPAGENKAPRWRVVLLWWVGLALVLLAWEAASWSQPRYVLPGPGATWEAPLGLLRD